MKPSVRFFWKFFGWGLVAFLLLILLANLGLFGKMPSLYELQNPSILQASEVYAIDGTLMGLTITFFFPRTLLTAAYLFLIGSHCRTL